MLFASHGLSAAEISSLFVIWSVTSFALEVPTGLLADVLSRRLLLTVAPVLVGAGFGVWTFAPSYPSFALGFVLWGAGGALRSGTLQALVYEELKRIGAAEAYARLIGRSQAVSSAAAMAATGLAAPVLAVGGFRAVGVASLAVTLPGMLTGWSLPAPGDRPRRVQVRGSGGRGLRGVLRGGVAEMRRGPRVRRALLLVAVLTGIASLDEYVPLLAQSTGVRRAAVPLMVLLVMAGLTVGGWLAGRCVRWLAPLLVLGAVCLAVGAALDRPAGLVLVAVAFGIFQWAIAAADARLQEHITDRARATITSVASVGAEVFAVLTFASFALGATLAGPGVLFALAALPYGAVALILWRPRAASR